ncbi:hypothetical protein FRC11_010184 [Ceratobasidium sp. 423]|nr:hypothetical protein FRC11_010184 [Ceratobasidium sp. 423]
MRGLRGLRQASALEFLRPFDTNNTTPSTGDFNPQVDIPAALNNYPNLDIVGAHIVNDFAEALGCSQQDAIVELAMQVPNIKAVHGPEGIVTLVHRQPNGDVGIVESQRFLNNNDLDWVTFDTDWRHRIMSRREIKRLRGLDHEDELRLF